jgi:glucan biosynthesis protein C
MNIQPAIIQRRYDLDWLRVSAILMVLVYHSTRFFNNEDWHVKNPTTYLLVDIWNTFASSWLMPIIFVISGASLFYAIGKSGAGKFVKDKFLRLMVPLLVGIFTHCTFQVYLERVTHGQFSGSFFQFLPHMFDGIYNEGNFPITGMHLWYLLVLFVFSLGCLPLFLLLKRRTGSRILGKLAEFLAIPGLIYLFAGVIILTNHLDPNSFFGFRDFGWTLGVYLSYFLIGYVIFSSERLQQSIQKLRWFSLLGLVIMTIVLLLGTNIGELIAWFFILAAFGFGMKHLKTTTPFLKYANEAVLPFYILHQTVLLSVGYFVVGWSIPDWSKWLIILSTSLVLIMVLYELLVHRINLVRFLFGMKMQRQASAIQVSQPQLGKAS